MLEVEKLHRCFFNIMKADRALNSSNDTGISLG